MQYRVMTRQGSLRVRNGPGLNFRVVSFLPRGAIINVLKTFEANHSVWCRVTSGWVSRRFLTPVQGERTAIREQVERRPPPAFLSFNPRIRALENRIAFLTRRIERAETLAYVNGQMAADEGSRLYEADSETERTKRIVNFVESFGAVASGAGPPGIDRSSRWVRMKEFERNAARYEKEVRDLEEEIRRIEQVLETLL